MDTLRIEAENVPSNVAGAQDDDKPDSEFTTHAFGAINGNVLPSDWRFDAFTEYQLDRNWT